MKKYFNFMEKLTETNKDTLRGRWRITYCKQTLNKRIDLANEDHCGVCYSTKYHNNSYIKYMNNIKKTNTDNYDNLIRYNRYIQIMNALKQNRDARDAKKKIMDANKNPIIDLE